MSRTDWPLDTLREQRLRRSFAVNDQRIEQRQQGKIPPRLRDRGAIAVIGARVMHGMDESRSPGQPTE